MGSFKVTRGYVEDCELLERFGSIKSDLRVYIEDL